MKNELIEHAKIVALQAGDLLMEMFANRLNIHSNEKGVKDVVTDADIKAEELIKEKLLEKYPEIPVISEESDMEKEHSHFENGDFWVIDPLDGTRNFSIGNPNFVVSIGYLDSEMNYHGVVHYPILKQTFYTKEGKSYLGDNLIRINETVDLDDAIVAYWDKREKDPSWDKPDILNSLRGKVKVLRMFGTSALEKAWVANGQVDLYIGNSSSIFGAVAGVALVRNAGGVALNFEGKDWRLGDIGILCGEENLVREVLPCLK